MKKRKTKIIGNFMVQVGRKERSVELRLRASPEIVLTLQVPSLRESRAGDSPPCPASIWRRG